MHRQVARFAYLFRTALTRSSNVQLNQLIQLRLRNLPIPARWNPSIQSLILYPLCSLILKRRDAWGLGTPRRVDCSLGTRYSNSGIARQDWGKRNCVLHSPPPQKYKVVATMFPEDENFKQWQSLESCWAVSSLNNKTMCLKRPFVYYISYPSEEMKFVIHLWILSSQWRPPSNLLTKIVAVGISRAELMQKTSERLYALQSEAASPESVGDPLKAPSVGLRRGAVLCRLRQ